MVAAAVVGAAVVGGVASSQAQKSSANKAASAQTQASQASIDEQRRQFDAIQELMKPYVNAGTQGLGGQQDLLGLNGADKQQAAIDAINNSSAMQTYIPNPVDAVSQSMANGFNMAASVDKAQQQREQIAIQKAQQSKMNSDLQNLASNPSPENYSKVMTLYPQLSENLKRSYETMDDGKKKTTLSLASQSYAALMNGQYESHLPTLNKPRENLSPELLAQPLLGNSGQLSGWVTSGTVETLVPIDLAKSPRKPDQNVPIDGVVTLTSSNHVQQTISFAVSEEVRTFKVVAWARYFPKAFLDRTNPAYSGYDSAQVVDRSVSGAIAPINKDTFDVQEIGLETWTGSHPTNNGAFQKDFVSLMWRPVTFYVEVQPYETDLSIRLNAVSGQPQLAKVSIKEVI